MARLKEFYKSDVAPAMMSKFGYKSVMQIPKLDKVVINVGAGEAKDNSKVIDEIVDELIEINAMAEDEATAKFNVDSKAQIIERDNEILAELTKELGEAFDGEGYDEAEEIFGSHLAMEEYLH